MTPGTLFVLIDTSKDGIIDHDEVMAFSKLLGNPSDTGFNFKAAFLTETDFDAIIAKINCRAPDLYIDYGELYDALFDTTEMCAMTTGQKVTIKYTRQVLAYDFLGFSEPVCPEYISPPPPSSPPPAPCSPMVPLADLDEEECGPYEESYAKPYGTPLQLREPFQMDTSLEPEEQYEACLTECCEGNVNFRVNGEYFHPESDTYFYAYYYNYDPCAGVYFDFTSGMCTLLTSAASFSLEPGTTDKFGTAVTEVTAKLLDYSPSRRSLSTGGKTAALPGVMQLAQPESENDDEDDEDDGEDLWEPLHFGNETHDAPAAAHRRMFSDAEPMPKHSALAYVPSPEDAAMNVSMAVAPLLAMLVGAIIGRPFLKAMKSQRSRPATFCPADEELVAPN